MGRNKVPAKLDVPVKTEPGVMPKGCLHKFFQPTTNPGGVASSSRPVRPDAGAAVPTTAVVAPPTGAEEPSQIGNTITAKRDKDNFDYQLKSGKLKPHIVDAWKELCADKTKGINGRKKDFQRQVLECTDPTQVADSFTSKRCKVEDTSATKGKTWISWKKFVDEEGEEEALIQVKANTVKSRRNPTMPEHVCPELKWPRYLQVKYIVEAELEASSDRRELGAEMDVTGDAADIVRAAFNDHEPVDAAPAASDDTGHPAPVMDAPPPAVMPTPPGTFRATAVTSSSGLTRLADIVDKNQQAEQHKCLAAVRGARRMYDSAYLDTGLVKEKGLKSTLVSDGRNRELEKKMQDAATIEQTLVGIDINARSGFAVDITDAKKSMEKMSAALKEMKKVKDLVSPLLH